MPRVAAAARSCARVSRAVAATAAPANVCMSLRRFMPDIYITAQGRASLKHALHSALGHGFPGALGGGAVDCVDDGHVGERVFERVGRRAALADGLRKEI